MARSRSNKKVAHGLVAMSSAAVMAVYSAGYIRTKPAADRLARQSIQRSMARQIPPMDQAPVPAEVLLPGETRPDPTAQSTQPSAEPERMIARVEKPSATPSTTKPLATDLVPEASTPAQSAIASADVKPTVPETPAPVNPAASATQPSTEPPAAVPFTAAAAAKIDPQPSTPVPAPSVAGTAWKDGKYVAWGGSRHGDIQATVVIEGGRIVSAEITDCQTRYPCDVIEKLPPQVAKRQSPNVDRVSGATESADAFYSAVYFALGQASRQAH